MQLVKIPTCSSLAYTTSKQISIQPTSPQPLIHAGHVGLRVCQTSICFISELVIWDEIITYSSYIWCAFDIIINDLC